MRFYVMIIFKLGVYLVLLIGYFIWFSMVYWFVYCYKIEIG